MEVECRALGGNPAPQLAWKLGNTWLEGAEVTEDEGSVTSILSLPLARVHHGSHLHCIVRHEALKGEMNARTKLNVQCK